MKTAEERKAEIKELSDKLVEGVQNVFNGDNYRKWLETCSRFHHYSVGNQILISLQKPDATSVAGFTTWKTLGRNVCQGEKAIKILCPSPYRKKVLEEEKDPYTGKVVLNSDGNPKTKVSTIIIQSFKVGNVFDISQTEGKELPQLVKQLTGDVQGYVDLMAALHAVSPVPITIQKINGAANGFYDRSERKIAIKEGLSELQTVKTGIHEITHAVLHDENTKDPSTREVEAESTAYIVCSHFGVPVDDYSLGYVAGWSSSRDIPELRASMETIRSTASTLINKIDHELDQIRSERMEETKTETSDIVPGIPFLNMETTEKATEAMPEKRPARHR